MYPSLFKCKFLTLNPFSYIVDKFVPEILYSCIDFGFTIDRVDFMHFESKRKYIIPLAMSIYSELPIQTGLWNFLGSFV